MKKIFLVSLVFLIALSANAEAIQTAAATTTPVEATTGTATTTTAAITDTTSAKKLTVKQKIQKFWNKISQFDFQSLNIIGKTEKFVASKKKQNLEAFEGTETGVWKHTKRTPASGKAKQIADQLDKTTQDKIKKYDSLSSY